MRRVALITGGSRGLGGALAPFLAAQDYDLVLTARNGADLERAGASVAHYGGRVRTVAGDVTDPAHRRALAEEAGTLGRLDLLVNNASELGPSPLPRLAEYPLDALERVFAVNVSAPLGLVQVTLPLLRRSGGMAVNITSDAAVGGYPGWGGYGASKAALELVSRTLAAELEGSGVTVVSVDPGDLRTRMHQDAFPGQDISDRPLPDATVPFWAWLLGQERESVHGGRFEAQAESWEPVG